MNAPDDRSRLLASLIGPILIGATVTETPNLAIWSEPDPTLTYLDGLLLFVGGVVVVRFHNRWSRRWPVAVTLAGWLLLASGLARMAAPAAPQPRDGIAAYTVIAALFLLGLFLSYKGFARGSRATAPALAR